MFAMIEKSSIGEISRISIPRWPDSVWALGDSSFLRGELTGFFCSRSFPARAVLPSLDWARRARERGLRVMSGFHSALERDVLEILLSGNTPAVMALARGIPERFRPDVRRGLESGLLTLASPFASEVRRPTAETAMIRNRLILSLCSESVAGWASPEGSLARLLSNAGENGHKIRPLCPR